MNIVLAIILSVFILGILIIIAWAATGASRRSKKEVPSLEHKALIQLQRLRHELSNIALEQYSNNSFRFYKRMKIVLTVYMKEKYGLTINETIDSETKRGLCIRFKNSEEDVATLQIFFNAMKRIKEDGMKHSDMCELYNAEIRFFRKKDTEEKVS